MRFDDILFVSAQPDVPYFHWQVRVYIENFISVGILPKNIHVIFGIVGKNESPSEESIKLTSLGVNVHHFKDERAQKYYIPSIKPFLIFKWLESNPQFGKIFFLHDSDIIFRVLPNFSNLLDDDFTYVSDTIGYIGYNYIMDCCKRYEDKYPSSKPGQLLTEMCDVIGVTTDCLKCNQENSGGGQYLIKNTDWLIWQKIYSECTPLYDTMMSYQKKFPISPGEIQFWTAEMWSLLWNLWYFGLETKVTTELDFSWATDTIRVYETKPILHMAGVTDDMKSTKFYKGEFINQNPIEKLKLDSKYFDYIEKTSSTNVYIDVMKSIIKKGF